jgi:hypothetical protein
VNAVATPTTIAGHRVLEPLGGSKRFEAFRVELASSPQGRATLYLMTEPVTHSDMFVEVANAVRASWPFKISTARDFILPEAQLWQERPWFVVPDSLPVVGSLTELAADARAALRAQLSWLSEFTHPWVDDIEFGHGDLRAPRVALLGGAQPAMIAPGWVAASDLARGRGLVDARVDDAWHLARLLASKAAAAQVTRPAATAASGSSLNGSASKLAGPKPVVIDVIPPAASPQPPPRAAVAKPVVVEPAVAQARQAEPISSQPAPMLTFESSTSERPISDLPPSDAAFAAPESDAPEAEVLSSGAPGPRFDMSTSRTAPTFPANSGPPSMPPNSLPPGPSGLGAARMPDGPPPFAQPQPPPAVPDFASTSLPSLPQPAPYAPNIPPLTVGQQPAGSGSSKWIIAAVVVIGVVLAALALLR